MARYTSVCAQQSGSSAYRVSSGTPYASTKPFNSGSWLREKCIRTSVGAVPVSLELVDRLGEDVSPEKLVPVQVVRETPGVVHVVLGRHIRLWFTCV